MSPAALAPLPDGDPFVSVVMPVRNESALIAESLGAVLTQDYPASHFEVLVVDGQSTDSTPDLVRSIAAGYPDHSVRVVANEGLTRPAGLNVGLDHAKGALVIAVDGHCTIAPDYLRRCVEVSRTTGAACVGGPIRTIGVSPTARAIAAAQSSRFGVGGVAFRTSGGAGPVDTVPFGAYRREIFDEVGTFDEHMVATEDDEMNLRITRSGHLIWMDPSIVSDYYARSDYLGLWRQYMRYGMFKVPVMQKHRLVPSRRHLVPAAFVLGTLGSIATAGILRRRWLAATVLGPYLALDGAASVMTARAAGVSPAAVAGATAIMHVAYGIGTMIGIARFWRGFRST